MATPKKQQKHAQRAKSKAKQNRVGKPAKASAATLIDNPFDDVKIDLSTFNFQDILDNGFDPADYDDLFQVMKAAEAISLQTMCTVFLQYPVLELVISEEEEEPATDFLMGLLIEYRIAVHGDDEDSAVAWIETQATCRQSITLSRKNISMHWASWRLPTTAKSSSCRWKPVRLSALWAASAKSSKPPLIPKRSEACGSSCNI